jgi:redox-sensitive bicupin YhaK (pirin superfamily)
MKTTHSFITRADERMHTQIGWLDSRHSFSFGQHYDPKRMGFGPLRVVNDDRIAPGGGFPTHPHRDMEIVSILLAGELEHRDSLGNGRVIRPGEIQYMSAGTGVKHSEFNPSTTETTHLLQIWIEPNAKGLAPRYADQPVIGDKDNHWSLILSPDGREGSMPIRQDVELRSVQLTPAAEIVHTPAAKGRGLWLFVTEGTVAVADTVLGKGDSMEWIGEGPFALKNPSTTPAQALLFDLPV